MVNLSRNERSPIGKNSPVSIIKRFIEILGTIHSNVFDERYFKPFVVRTVVFGKQQRRTDGGEVRG